jgi:subtilisin family serine protease
LAWWGADRVLAIVMVTQAQPVARLPAGAAYVIILRMLVIPACRVFRIDPSPVVVAHDSFSEDSMSSRPGLSAVLILVAAGLLWSPLHASEGLAPHIQQKVDPALINELAQLPRDTMVPIIVTMQEQADLERLDDEITHAGLGRDERARSVIAALRAVAASSQPALESKLAAWRASGQVADYTAHWLVSAFSLSATQDVVLEIAGRGDVARVSLDSPLELDYPIEESPAPASPGQAEVGLRAVNAPALWALGYTGAGVIVMNIDTGVDGDHPALADRWLGASPGVAAEHAWFDPVRQNCTTPCDYGTHGSHTMGIMTGLDPATADTVGVAFGASWIAAATIDVGAFPHTSFSLAAFEWAVSPGPSETRDPADVISCSWRDSGVNQAGDCGPNGTYWAVIDAFETIGGAVVFSAGNGGPGAQTITRPKNRISSPVNAWATGNVNANQAGFPIQNGSSRGPSDCDGQTIKPEAVAPGTSIRSTVPNGYGFKTGTSMASPHAGGVIALLMEAHPWATGTEIKLALIATAMDLGTPGEDNTYGNGLIDAGAAYQFLLGAAALREQVYAPTPAGVSLSQNVPNPFNPSTSISYDLPDDSIVSLRVYDARGRVVATVVGDEKHAPGRTAERRAGREQPAACTSSGWRRGHRPTPQPRRRSGCDRRCSSSNAAGR